MKLTVIGTVSKFVLNESMNDLRSKEAYNEMFTLLSDTTTRVSRVRDFKEEGKKIKSNNRKRDFNLALTTVLNMISINKVVDTKQLEVATMKKLSALVKFLDKIDKIDAINSLDTIKGVGVSYNNAIGIKMGVIRKENTEEVASRVLTYKEVHEDVARMSTPDREKLMLELMNEFGYEVEGVA